MNELHWLHIAFMGLMGFSILVYAILDGYDLGVGILLPLDEDSLKERDRMIASIGPFWDANETWLVLAVGLMLIAFPEAHNLVLKELYLPTTVMLIGLILRGVAFDFRAKAVTTHRITWDRLFKLGSLVTTLSQGYMLGRYVLGFTDTAGSTVFALASALCVTAAYTFIGGAWLVMKTEGDLQKRAAKWSRVCAWFAAAGILLVSIINPLVSERVFDKWLSFPNALLLLPIPLACAALFVLCDRYLRKVPHQNDAGSWIPFASAVAVFFLCFQSLAYSFYPYVVPGELLAADAAAANESLMFIFYGAVVVVPCIIGYTFFSYRVFWGKASDLKYF